MNRLRSGYVLVRNPAVKNVVYRIELDPKNVDCFIFLSKNPQPIEKHLDEIEKKGFQSLFQITITPYGKDIEPNLPDKNDVIDSFIRISEKVGKEKMLWRYDPVLFDDDIDIGYHEEQLERLCSRMEGTTDRCTFSFLSSYDKLDGLYRDGTLRDVADNEKIAFAKTISSITKKHGIEANICCTGDDLSLYGVKKRGCIDKDTMRSLNIPYETTYSPLRKGCMCVKSIDIGAYDTCLHNCIYCYANSASDSRRNRTYDPNNEMISGKLEKDDEVVILGRKNTTLSQFF